MIELERKSFAKDFALYCLVGFNIGLVIGIFLYLV